jgi:hypothetical protein
MAAVHQLKLMEVDEKTYGAAPIVDAPRDFTEANEGNDEPTAGFLLPVEFHELVNVIH